MRTEYHNLPERSAARSPLASACQFTHLLGLSVASAEGGCDAICCANRSEGVEWVNCTGDLARSPLASACQFTHLLGPSVVPAKRAPIPRAVLRTLIGRCGLQRKLQRIRLWRVRQTPVSVRKTDTRPQSGRRLSHPRSGRLSHVQFCAHSSAAAVCNANCNVLAFGEYDKPRYQCAKLTRARRAGALLRSEGKWLIHFNNNIA